MVYDATLRVATCERRRVGAGAHLTEAQGWCIVECVASNRYPETDEAKLTFAIFVVVAGVLRRWRFA